MFFSKNNYKNSGLKPGSVISVCSKEEITQTLDAMNKCNGVLFMDEMWRFCDQKYTILKEVIHFFDENRLMMHKTRGPLYLLENGICSGNIESFSRRCDRSCYFLWEKEWLKQEI